MARHPILSKRLFKRIRTLFKRTPRRSASKRKAHMASAAASSSPIKQDKSVRVKPPSVPDSAYASADRVAAARKLAKPGTFWSNLFWVRPWLLVVALWLTFILMIAIALAGLSSPGREMALDPIDNSLLGQPLSTPDAAAVSRLIPGDAGVSTQRDPAATLPGATEQSMPAWPLLVMVAACAGGCMLMSHQGVLTPEPRRGRRRGGVMHQVAAAAPRQVPTRLVARPGKRQRRKQRRLGTRRSAAQVLGLRTVRKVRPAAGSVISAKPTAYVIKAEAAPSVTVVPEKETSPLDWKEGSLAHKLDVRQTRSINSFL